MSPRDKLLSDHPALEVYAMAEPGHQYLVFSPDGATFSLEIDQGTYESVSWIDAETGNKGSGNQVVVENEQDYIAFEPPNQQRDWVLIVEN